MTYIMMVEAIGPARCYEGDPETSGISEASANLSCFFPHYNAIGSVKT